MFQQKRNPLPKRVFFDCLTEHLQHLALTRVLFLHRMAPVPVLILSVLLTSPALAQDRQTRIDDAFSTRLLVKPQRSFSAPEPTFNFRSFRTIDGTLNNLTHQLWGSTGSNLWRRAPDAYGDGLSFQARSLMPSPREISNAFCDQQTHTVNSRALTDMVWQWGQFLDHDIDLTESHEPLEALPISVPAGDPWFDPAGTGTQQIFFFRSEFNMLTGTFSPRQQINSISTWIDGSNVYGSDIETANSLRTFRRGKLKTSSSATGPLLPEDEDGFFLAGDVRANEQVYLTSMHTLFVREHNRVADQFFRFNPRLTDEQIYLHSRKRVVATMQAITFNEFLPALLGENAMGPYRGYKPNVYPNITNSFSTAAFRFGHSMLSSELLRLDRNNDVIDAGNLSLADAFFNPDEVREHGIEPYLNGQINQLAKEIDVQIVDDVRNFLFGAPGSGGFDLASLNIQRGRDHGLPGINIIREAYGLPRVHFFSLTGDGELTSELRAMYGSINTMDPWLAMLAEEHAPGASVGMTAWFVIRDQFDRLRHADRFWYERDLRGSALRAVKQTKLSDVIRRNTTLNNVRQDVFTLPN